MSSCKWASAFFKWNYACILRISPFFKSGILLNGYNCLRSWRTKKKVHTALFLIVVEVHFDSTWKRCRLHQMVVRVSLSITRTFIRVSSLFRSISRLWKKQLYVVSCSFEHFSTFLLFVQKCVVITGFGNGTQPHCVPHTAHVFYQQKFNFQLKLNTQSVWTYLARTWKHVAPFWKRMRRCRLLGTHRSRSLQPFLKWDRFARKKSKLWTWNKS